MKKSFLLAVLLSLAAFMVAATSSVTLGTLPTSAELIRDGSEGLTVRYSIEKLDFEEVQTKEGLFTEISVAQYTTTNRVGQPKLPLLRQIISVPEGAQVRAEFSSALQETYLLSDLGWDKPIIPKQESISKSEDPEKVPFIIDHGFYGRNAWTDEPAIAVTELGHMRGYRLFALDFTPIRYNPADGRLEVIYSAEVEVDFINPDHIGTRELRAKTFSPAFEAPLRSILLNPDSERVSLNRYPMGYLIITPPNFVDALEPFIEWKKQEGYNVILATTNETGTTTNSIKSYIQGIWNDATVDNPAPSYLLIVGDTPQIPSNTGNTASHVTDLTYVRLQGTDYIPEMYFGRFSATTAAEVTNQVNKTLMHEKYAMPDDSYLQEVVMIAGVDSYWSNTHANGAINYSTGNYFNTAHGIDSHTYLYPASASSSSAIIQNVSNGAGYVNYTAHGSETSWADPSFTINNINNLQNTNQYPVVVGNCCSTSAFNIGVCFAEAWLRAVDKGAVIYVGGTNSTYWDEDYWWAVGWKPPIVGTGSPFVPGRTGAYDAMFHEHDEPFEDWGSNVAAMMFMANMAVVQANSSRANMYWEIYSIMGDPSLIPWLGIPENNSFQAPQTLFLGLGSLDVIADPYTYVAISMDGELHGVGLTDGTGLLSLNYAPFTEPGTARIVLTRSLRKPMIVDVPVIPNVGPYVTVSPIGVVDPNLNGIAEAGETISMDLTFNNVGIQEATNLTATLSTENPFVSLLESSIDLPNIPAEGQVVMDGVFSVLFHLNIPDQEKVFFDISVSDGTNEWVSTRSLTVNAPELAFGNVTMIDSNGDGFLQPGEDVSITLNLTNNGHMAAESGELTILAHHPGIILSTDGFILPSLGVEVTIPVTFTVSLGPDLADGDMIPIGLSLAAGAQNLNYCVVLPIGMMGDGFETGDFSAHDWQNDPSVPWTIETSPSNVHSGIFSAKSGAIGHNTNTDLSITMNVGAAGNISFWRKVSSENNYDWLRFSIDDIEQGSWSGNRDWDHVSYAVTPGLHTFKWSYTKDYSVSSGSDCAWIDDIVFPLSGSGDIAMIFVPQEEIVFTNVTANAVLSADFVVNNLGTVPLSGHISYPTEMELILNGTPVANNAAYSVEVGEGYSYTLKYTVPNPAQDLTGEIVITSNDTANPAVVIPVRVDTGTATQDAGNIPLATALEGNYPNPFNPETSIAFALKEGGNVRLAIYNVKGQLIRTLVDDKLPAGRYQAVWNGKDEAGRGVSSGIYLYRMESADYCKTMKMMLMK